MVLEIQWVGLIFTIVVPVLIFYYGFCAPDDFEDGSTMGWNMGASPNAVNIPSDTTWAGLPAGVGGTSDNYMVLMPLGLGAPETSGLSVKNEKQWIGDLTTLSNIVLNVYNLTGSDSVD